MVERYYADSFMWYYSTKDKKVFPLLLDLEANQIENFNNNEVLSVEGLKEKNREDLTRIFEEKYGEGKTYTCDDFIKKILNCKERDLYGGDAERNGLQFCKFDKKEINLIGKVFTRAANRKAKEEKKMEKGA